MKRVPTAELLDSDSGTPAEITASLHDLRNINVRFGGVATTQAMLRHVADQTGMHSFNVLEVAAGAGDTPRLVKRHLSTQGIELHFTLLDRAPSHLGNGNSEFARVAGDALALPFDDNSFDLVTCNLFVHHLSPDQVVQFAGEGLRVGRKAFLINDLVRSPWHLALVYAGMPLFHSRITRHDAPASVRQSYTPAEMKALLRKTRAACVEIERHYLYRMGITAWKT